MRNEVLKPVSSLLIRSIIFIMILCIGCFISNNTKALAVSILSSAHTEEISVTTEEFTVTAEETDITETETGFTAAEIDHVQDLADILSDEEEAALREECISVGEINEIDILILTTNSVPSNRKIYLEDFYDANDDVLSDAVLVLVNMDPDNRGVEIQGYGQCEFSISDDRIESILDEIVPFLSAGEYYGAFSTYIYKVDYYMSIEAASDYVHTEQDNLNYNEHYYEETHPDKGEVFKQKTLFNLLIAAVIGAVSVAIMAINSKGKITTNRSTYMDPKNSRLLGHWDRYIRTSTTRVRKPKDNGGSSHSGGGGGVSRGGHSHSGGGRSF